jgi:hypothetical protein
MLSVRKSPPEVFLTQLYSTVMKALSLILITALCFVTVGCSSGGTSTKLKNKLKPETHILFEGAY